LSVEYKSLEDEEKDVRALRIKEDAVNWQRKQ